MDRGAWQATVHGLKELDMTEQLTFSLFFHFSTVSIGHVLENADTQHYSTMDSTEYLESDKSRFKISTLLPFSWVTLDKLLDLPESQFPHL